MTKSTSAAPVVDRRHWLERIHIKFGSIRDRLVTSPSELKDIFRSDATGQALSTLFLGHALAPDSWADIEGKITQCRRELEERPFGVSLAHNGTATLGRVCSAVCRALRPNRVVETGVAYGVTSAYILDALATNELGTLHSIDLPPLAHDAEACVGYMVPADLRRRWDLRIGSARRLLPALLRENALDVFIHDSLHTYSHMKWEFELALGALRPGGVIIADDIEGNRAFEETVRHPSIDSWFAIEQEGKTSICGVMRKKLR